MARKKQNLESMEFEGDEPGLPAMDEAEEVAVEEPVEPEPEPEPAEPEPAEPEPEQPEPEQSEPFPLTEGHYVFTPVLSSRGHSSGPAVRRVRELLGLSEGEEFDAPALVAVQDFQKQADLPMSGVVDAETWDAISSRYA